MNRSPISLYTDGAFDQRLRHGAWAFYVPVYQAERSGSDEGLDAGQFEVKAVLEGVRWILSNDASGRPIFIYTDSLEVLQVVEWSKPKAQRGKVRPVIGDLFRELQEFHKQRPVSAGKVSDIANPGLKRCHDLAAVAMTQKVEANPMLARIVKPIPELEKLLMARDSLRRKLARLEHNIAYHRKLLRQYDPWWKRLRAKLEKLWPATYPIGNVIASKALADLNLPQANTAETSKDLVM